jgi:GNAT superfamily N-acetyltransferase
VSARTITLRAPGPDDVPALIRMMRGFAEYEKLLREMTATEGDLHDALFGPQPRIHAVLAEADGKAVGYAAWYFTFSTFSCRPDLFVEDVYVESDWRERGVGLALFRHMARIAQSENCARMEWRVLNWNEPAIRFYDRIGARTPTDWMVKQLGGDALANLGAGVAT